MTNKANLPNQTAKARAASQFALTKDTDSTKRPIIGEVTMLEQINITIHLSEEDQETFSLDDIERLRKDMLKVLPDELRQFAHKVCQRTGAEVQWSFPDA